MIKHEFLLLDRVPDKISISDFPRNEMILLSDDFILSIYPLLKEIDMHWESWGVLHKGLNYYGTTILDNCMALKVKEVLCQHCKSSQYLVSLISLLDESIINNKYIVHFGI